MSARPLNLPEVSADELQMARAYLNSVLGDATAPEGEEFIHLLARYGFLRQHQEGYLRNLAGQMNADELPADMQVLKRFHGVVCAGCDGEKPQDYWVCRTCWKRLPREFTSQLWRGFRTRDIPVYFQAVAWLKANGSGQG